MIPGFAIVVITAIVLFVVILTIRMNLIFAMERERDQRQRLQEIERRTRQEHLCEQRRERARSVQSEMNHDRRGYRPLIGEAERRAERLLMENLSEKQRADYLANGGFYIRGISSIYRIDKNSPHIVHGFRHNGAPYCSYGYGVRYGCGSLTNGVSHRCHTGDEMLSKKLAIEADEARFLREACTSPPRTYRTVDMNYVEPSQGHRLLSLVEPSWYRGR